MAMINVRIMIQCFLIGFIVSKYLFHPFGGFVQGIHLFHTFVEGGGEHHQCLLGFGIRFFGGGASVLSGRVVLQIPSGTEQ